MSKRLCIFWVTWVSVLAVAVATPVEARRQFTAQIQLALQQLGIWPYDGSYSDGELPVWNAASNKFLGGAGFTPTAIAASTCAAPGLALAGAATNGIAFTATPSILNCIGGTAVTTLTGAAWTSTVPILVPDGTAAAPSVALGVAGTGIFRAGANIIGLSPDGVERWRFYNTALEMISSADIRWSAGAIGAGADLFILRDAANVLALRNGASAQAQRWYRTYTDGSNYARASVFFSGNDIYFGQDSGDIAGTGAAGDLILTTTTGKNAGFRAGGSHLRWTDVGGGTLTAGPIFAMGAAAAATTAYEIVKKVTGIADNAATDVLTVTVPNANHAASVSVRLLCSTGSTDAFESTRTAEGFVVLARTTGVATVAAVTTLEQAQIATVAAGATLTLAYGVSAIAGAVGATQTFTVTATVNDSGNVGANQCVVGAKVLNAEATGVTIS